MQLQEKILNFEIQIAFFFNCIADVKHLVIITLIAAR